ncbi:MAG TPA: sulfurtransferase-like selenium metabolism protein YedF [Candidatus Lachnoclostridium pullistercoris]|uniref:Sulfurtransferase-like selenium metabolism protein YedF n=1 Tax=Candidatus Lachnoclostridium pullistercoris TaxID=2838632 RepID=A0A9D2PB89_9FIRM|nr:sulfurtransferase-like selenium metabolism protein YedF [Candidatus Lachnoclostridium pullistercoris]
MKQTIDMRGVACPGPVVAVKKKTDDMIAGELLVLVDNQAAVQNLEKFAEYKGFSTSWEKSGDKEYAVQILVGQKALRDVDSYFDIYDRKQEEVVRGLPEEKQKKVRPQDKRRGPVREAEEVEEELLEEMERLKQEERPEAGDGPKTEDDWDAGCDTCDLSDAGAVLGRLLGTDGPAPERAEVPEPHPAAPGPKHPLPHPEHPAPHPDPVPRPEPVRAPLSAVRPSPAGPMAHGTILVISSDSMGEGDEALGRLLMKGFLYAMVEQERLPEKILFYNSGVFLTTEGSGVLEDLQEMERRGVRILTCGTCLNHFNLLDRLQVGEVTNMYEIAQCMMQAERIIKP